MNFPHQYVVQGRAQADGLVTLSGEKLQPLQSAPPAQFGGPGTEWSPEDLLVAAVADCFILSFRAIAAASKFAFNELNVTVDGSLDRVEREMLFTEFKIHARLSVAADVDAARAQRLLEKAEQTCLVTNSLKSKVHLHAEVVHA
ncbi:MAG: OsmC family protein [Pirellulaceae bacterium]